MTERELQALRRLTERHRKMNASLATFNRKIRDGFPAFDAAFRGLRAALDRSYRV